MQEQCPRRPNVVYLKRYYLTVNKQFRQMANSTVDDQQGIWGTDFSQVNKQLMVSLMIGKLLITVGKSRGIKFLTVLLRRFSSFLFPRLMEHILKWLSKIII